ncbi:MAG: hypothetical protein K6G83_10915 [Lachnospiraceae bacterium]|nr:hypothetical protein [Lachnospiraceae bacterium]
MKKRALKYSLLYAALVAVTYLLFDLSVQYTGYLRFSGIVGLKNFLPLVTGLFFGAAGVAGTAVGGLVSGLILQNDAGLILAELLCNLIMSLGFYELYHFFSKEHRIQLKKRKQILRFSAILAGLSVVCGVVGSLVSSASFAEVFSAYFFLGLLVGLPLCILFSSLLCIKNIIPGRYVRKPDIGFVLDASAESLGLGNEAIEDFALAKKIGMKRVFEVENCLEELYIRVIKALPETRLTTEIYFSDVQVSDSVSVHVYYPGERYNPLFIGGDEEEMDLIGLNLLRHRALRASCTYIDRENRIHIVL